MANVTATFQNPAPTDVETDAAPAPTTRPQRWERVGLAVLLVGTAVMYLWNITVNGMGNQFYAGAAMAGSKNWEALLFGSLARFPTLLFEFSLVLLLVRNDG